LTSEEVVAGGLFDMKAADGGKYFGAGYGGSGGFKLVGGREEELKGVSVGWRKKGGIGLKD
jgi:hypothetical protein